jgi:predicted dehydrogenase
MRVAILGCGHISEQHVRTLKKISAVDLVGVCDLNLEHARALSERHQIPEVHKNIDDLLAGCNPDVVHILTPPQSHRPLAVQILSAGCNVLIEKPFALNAQDANDIVQAGKQHSASVSVCHNFLYMPAMQKALRMIKNGELGKIISAEAYWRVSSLQTDSRPDAHVWVEAMPGGIFHEVGPHVVYLLRAILGDLDVTAASYAGEGTEKDELRVQLKSGSQLAALTISGIEAPIQKYIRVFGTRMSLHIDLGSNVLVRLRSWGKNMPARALLNVDHAAQLVGGTTGNIALALVGKMPRSHPRFMQAYYQNLLNSQPADVSGEDGAAVTKVLDQIWAQLKDQEANHKQSN